MKDRLGVEVNVGDIVAYGEKVWSKGGRAWTKVGIISSIDRYVHVPGEYSGLTSQSFIKCSPNFARMLEDNSIYNI